MRQALLELTGRGTTRLHPAVDGGGATVTLTAWNARPPDPARLWPWILLLFRTVGLFALRWSFSVEAAKLVVAGPARAEIERGPPLRRRRHALDRLKLELIEDGGIDRVPRTLHVPSEKGGAWP